MGIDEADGACSQAFVLHVTDAVDAFDAFESFVYVFSCASVWCVYLSSAICVLLMWNTFFWNHS
jgi:hypothetical protein